MNQHRKFTKEFAAEAVALLHSSGRTRRQVADDLGIGLLTLARWSRESQDRGDGKPDASSNEDIVAELKRPRRENEALRQERDILKKATVFFAKEGRSRRPMIRGIVGTVTHAGAAETAVQAHDGKRSAGHSRPFATGFSSGRAPQSPYHKVPI